jgi:hypothetical protein
MRVVVAVVLLALVKAERRLFTLEDDEHPSRLRHAAERALFEERGPEEDRGVVIDLPDVNGPVYVRGEPDNHTPATRRSESKRLSGVVPIEVVVRTPWGVLFGCSAYAEFAAKQTRSWRVLHLDN